MFGQKEQAHLAVTVSLGELEGSEYAQLRVPARVVTCCVLKRPIARCLIVSIRLLTVTVAPTGLPFWRCSADSDSN